MNNNLSLSFYEKHRVSNYLYLKYNFNNSIELPKLKKITLTIHLYKNNLNTKQVVLLVIIIELISLQKGFVIKKKQKSVYKSKTYFSLQVTLRNRNIYNFLKSFIKFNLPKTFYINKLLTPNSFDRGSNYTINTENLLSFKQLENEYKKFNNILKNRMEIRFYLTSKEKNISKYLLNSFLLPIL